MQLALDYLRKWLTSSPPDQGVSLGDGSEVVSPDA